MERAGASLLGNPDELARYKRHVFDRVEVRDARGNRASYAPHEGQEKIHFGDWSFLTAACGRRGGKSTAMRMEANVMLGIEGTHTGIGAPTYKLTDRVFQEVWQDVVIDGLYPVRRKSNSDSRRYIETEWGSWLEGFSAERPESSKGLALDLLLDDECAEHSEDFFTKYIGPGLADRMGRAIFTSTPVGMNWFEEYFKRGRDPKFKKLGWASVRWTSKDNPYLDKGWLDGQKQTVSEYVWRQEYLAEFVAPSGLVWPDYRDEYHDGPNGGHLFNPDIEPVSPHWWHGRAIDIGFRDPTAGLWYSVDPNDDVWFHQEYLVQDVLHQDHARAIKARTKFPTASTVMSWDATQNRGTGDRTVKEIYDAEGIFSQPSIRNRDLGIAVVAGYLRATIEDAPTHPRVYISDRLTRLRAGIQRYQFDPKSTKPKPLEKDDDIVDAFRYALVAKPSYTPDWMREESGMNFIERYGYQKSAFRNMGVKESPGYNGIAGISSVPRF